MLISVFSRLFFIFSLWRNKSQKLAVTCVKLAAKSFIQLLHKIFRRIFPIQAVANIPSQRVDLKCKFMETRVWSREFPEHFIPIFPTGKFSWKKHHFRVLFNLFISIFVCIFALILTFLLKMLILVNIYINLNHFIQQAFTSILTTVSNGPSVAKFHFNMSIFYKKNFAKNLWFPRYKSSPIYSIPLEGTETGTFWKKARKFLVPFFF